jgi:cation/acetate symporter
MLGGWLGDGLGALLTAGAFAAFLSTSSGLTVSVAGVLSQDLLGRWMDGITAFRVAGCLAVVAPLSLALLAQDLPIAQVVGLAFAVAASTFCPLLVLGIWWRRLTPVGAIAGLLVGGSLSGAAVLLTVLGFADGGWPGALLVQPGAWTVPTAFAVMVVVSLATPHRVTPNVRRTMVRLHMPEQIEVDRGDFQPRAAGLSRSKRSR